MKVRIEFARSGSSAFKQVLALCKKLSSFKRMRREGLAIYSVEFSGKDLEAFEPIHEHILSCDQVAVYIDGNPIDNWKASERAREALVSGKEKAEAIEDLMRRVNQDMREREKPGDVSWPTGGEKEDDKELDDE